MNGSDGDVQVTFACVVCSRAMCFQQAKGMKEGASKIKPSSLYPAES